MSLITKPGWKRLLRTTVGAALLMLLSSSLVSAADPPPGISGAVVVPGKVGGAVHQTDVGDNEAILFELEDFESQSGKFKIRLKLQPGEIYLPADLNDLHPRLAQTGPERSLIRSIAMGKNIGVLIRVNDTAWIQPQRGPYGTFAVFPKSVRRLEKPFINNWNPTGVILFRKDIVSHPQGVAFSNRNPWGQLSGPLADDFQSTFFLANSSNTREIPAPVADSIGWATLYGKGTKLTIWVKGSPREIVATSNDPRENTFYLPDEGMRLSKIEPINQKRNGYTLAHMKITAPKFAEADGTLDPIFNMTDLINKDPIPPISGMGGNPGANPGGNPGGSPGGANKTAILTLVGVWRQLPNNAGIPSADVTIGQDNAHPENFTCRIPQMKLFGKGKITKGGSITASFGQPNADMTDFGPLGVFAVSTGKVTKTDAAGRAMRIEWNNGVVYERK